MSLVPGLNILALANKVIAAQTIQYFAYASRDANSIGILQTSYASAVTIQANIQPVPRNRYENMGLDFQKNYVTIYVQKNVIDIERDVTGDRFAYAGKIYLAESRTEWFAQDGWDAVLCAEVPHEQEILAASAEIITYAKATLQLGDHEILAANAEILTYSQATLQIP